MEPPYEYDPLNLKGMFTRIIRLKPAVEFRETLHCEVLVIDLTGNERNDYEAISYTWKGQNPSPEHSILCHSKNSIIRAFFITESSDAALRRMRLEHEDRYLWMDSICINQKCLNERNHQVALMGYIYTLAKRVLIWLGENVTKYIKKIAAYDPTDPDIERQLKSVFEEIRKGDERFCLLGARKLQQIESKSEDSRFLGREEKWSLLEDVFRRPWFRRVWTLQEIALNTEDPLFHCGDQTIEWSQIMSTMRYMREYTFDHLAVLDEAMGTFLELKSQVQQWRSAWSPDLLVDQQFLKFEPTEGPRPRLSKILASARNRESSEPKDKAYGVYGICQFLDVHMPPPRYEQSLEQIFFEMTWTIIEGENDLSVLYETDGPDRNSNLPSWVPDWEHDWTRKYGAPITLSDNFHAGGNTPLSSIDPELKV